VGHVRLSHHGVSCSDLVFVVNQQLVDFVKQDSASTSDATSIAIVRSLGVSKTATHIDLVLRDIELSIDDNNTSAAAEATSLAMATDRGDNGEAVDLVLAELVFGMDVDVSTSSTAKRLVRRLVVVFEGKAVGSKFGAFSLEIDTIGEEENAATASCLNVATVAHAAHHGAEVAELTTARHHIRLTISFELQSCFVLSTNTTLSDEVCTTDRVSMGSVRVEGITVGRNKRSGFNHNIRLLSTDDDLLTLDGGLVLQSDRSVLVGKPDVDSARLVVDGNTA